MILTATKATPLTTPTFAHNCTCTQNHMQLCCHAPPSKWSAPSLDVSALPLHLTIYITFLWGGHCTLWQRYDSLPLIGTGLGGNTYVGIHTFEVTLLSVAIAVLLGSYWVAIVYYSKCECMEWLLTVSACCIEHSQKENRVHDVEHYKQRWRQWG